jgi:hypothetical protein
MSDAEVRIRTARVRGLRSRGDVQPLLRRIELSPWPSLDPRRTVVIRSLRLQTTSAALEAALGRALQAALTSAFELVPGASPPPGANAVLFASPAVRLACFATDVASRAATRSDSWWWGGTPLGDGGSPATTIADAWAGEPLWLPAVVAELARHERLAPVWATLSAAAAERLLVALAAAHALPAARLQPPPTVPEAGTALAATALSAPPRGDSEPVLAGSLRAPWPAPLRRRWKAALLNLPRSDARVRLAAVLAALEAAPACLTLPAPEPFFAWLAEAPVSAPPRASANTEPAPRTVDPTGRVATPPAAPLHESPAPTSARITSQGVKLPVTAACPAAEGAPVASDFAGAVFVTNALAHPELQGVWQPEASLHGWRWWRGLCAGLELSPRDPFAQLLAEACAQAAEVADPGEEALTRFHAAARATYGECWSPELLRVAGSVRIGPTHIDVWLPLASVRLGVRRAGLDLNPGWLPWLGRVVNIHYLGTA